MNDKKQRRAMCLEYEAKGYTVIQDATSDVLGLDLPYLPFTLDIVAIGRNHSRIIEIASRDRPEDEAMARFEAISAAVASRPAIEFDIRFYDLSERIDKFGKDLKKLRASDPSNPAYDALIDLLLKHGLVFKDFKS